MRAAWSWLCVLLGCSELTQPATNRSSIAVEPATAASGTAGTADYVHAGDILIAYKGALRAADNNQRSKDDAKKLAGELRRRLRAGEDFAKLAREYSDDPVGRARGGDLGSLGRDDHVKPFIDAAFALKPGQLSDLVETSFGYHIILRKD